jgi:arsenate reductase
MQSSNIKISSNTDLCCGRAWVDGMGEMTNHKPKVLFLSTGNATRSLIAEGFLRTLTGDRFDVVSAGVEPSALNPLANEVMKEAGIDISGQKPKSVAQ